MRTIKATHANWIDCSTAAREARKKPLTAAEDELCTGQPRCEGRRRDVRLRVRNALPRGIIKGVGRGMGGCFNHTSVPPRRRVGGYCCFTGLKATLSC